MVLEDDSFEKCLVTSINRRILFAVSLAIIRAKPEHTSYAEYCHELRRNTINTLKQNDPYGILRLHQKQSILNCIKELIPVSTKQNDSATDSLFDEPVEETQVLIRDTQNSQKVPFENFTENTSILDNDVFKVSNGLNESQETQMEWEYQRTDSQLFDSGVHSDQQKYDTGTHSINTKKCVSEVQTNNSVRQIDTKTLNNVNISKDIILQKEVGIPGTQMVLEQKFPGNQKLDDTRRGIETKKQPHPGVQTTNNSQNRARDNIKKASIEQKLENFNESMDVLFQDEETNLPSSFQNTTKEIRNDIEFLKTILSLKAQLKLCAEISTDSLLNILSPSSIQGVSNEKYSKISSQIVEYKLQQLNSEQMIETMFGQVLEFLQEKVFSDLQYLRTSLLFYKGSDLELYIDSIQELLPLCPKHFHYKTFQFIQKQTKEFFVECDINFEHESLEQVSFLLPKLCHTKPLLIKQYNYISHALNSLAHRLKHLPSRDSITSEPKLLRRLQNSAHLLSMGKQCLRQITSNEKDDNRTAKEKKELDKLVTVWRKRNRKIIKSMKEHLFLYVIESDGMFEAKVG
ncbi:hypothetical protein WDU94_012007 [Cyamophila willieti]